MNYNIIITGKFSKNGNFIGINHKKEEIHIYKAQMNTLNLNSIADIKFPLFAFGSIQKFDRLTGKTGDENRKLVINNLGVKETFERLTAAAVYNDFDSFINAFTHPIVLSLVTIEHLKSFTKNDGITSKILLSIDSELDIIKKNHLEAEKAFREYFEYKISMEKL